MKLSRATTYLSRGISPAYDTDGVVVLNQKCIRDNRVDLSHSRMTNPNKKRISDDKYLQQYDVVVNSTGVGTLGRVAQIKQLDQPITVDSHVTIVRPDLNKYDPLYFGYAMFFAQPQIERMGDGATGQTELSKTRLSDEIDIPELSKSTQLKIGGILGAYDNLIENNSNRIEKLETMARLLFNDWYSKFLLTSDETKPVTDLFEIKYGKTLPKTKFQSDGMYPIYGGGGVIGYYDKNTFNEPVCLITSRGNGSGTVWGTIEAAFITNNSFTVAAKTDTKGLSAGFIQLLMEKLPIKSALSGSAQPQLTLDSLSHINSPYIKYKDAENIDGYVASAFSLIYLLQQKNRKLAKARDLLLPRLMSGEVEV